LIAEKDQIDFVLFGAGRDMQTLPAPIAQRLRDAAMVFEVMNTNAAVRTYNVVLDEGRRVAAVLLAVDKAYG